MASAGRSPVGALGDVLADPELPAVIDLTRLVCVIFGAVLHFMDAGAARALTARYARGMAPGSCLVISVASVDDEGLGKQLAGEYTAAAWHNHTPADVASFFAGLELVGPGVTEAQTWRPWMPGPVLWHRDGHVLVGVARAAHHRAVPESALISAAMAGSRRSFSRHRPRYGPMLSTAMPSRALISAYGTGGSAHSRAISR